MRDMPGLGSLRNNSWNEGFSANNLFEGDHQQENGEFRQGREERGEKRILY